MIESARLRLMDFDPSCITDEYLGWLNDKQHMQWSRQKLFEHTRESSLKHLASFAGTANRFWSIRLKDTNQQVGTATLYRDGDVGDIGILIAPSGSGKGYGSEAWAAVMKYMFDVENITAITGGTVIHNEGMVRVFERCHMDRVKQSYSEQYQAEIVQYRCSREQWYQATSIQK